MLGESSAASIESDPVSRIGTLSLGLTPYHEAWELQQQFQQQLISGSNSEQIITCEHPLVITLGRSAKRENILLPEATLAAAGIQVLEIERGGDVTLHNPGQLVIYPILNLTNYRRDVGWYLRSLEEIVIRTLFTIGLEGFRITGRTGVWVRSTDGVSRKIASIGVRISRWCTLHGLAFNINNDLNHFSLIHPCGFREIEMTSVAREMAKGQLPSRNALESRCIQELNNIFR